MGKKCYLKPKLRSQCERRNCKNCQVWLERVFPKEGTHSFDKDKCMSWIPKRDWR